MSKLNVKTSCVFVNNSIFSRNITKMKGEYKVDDHRVNQVIYPVTAINTRTCENNLFELKSCANNSIKQNNILVMNNIKTESLSFETDNNINNNRTENDIFVDPLYTEEADIKWVNIDNQEIGNNKINHKIEVKDEIVSTTDIKIESCDEQLYCDSCHEYYQDYCTKCRMLIHILNRSPFGNAYNLTKVEIPNNILEIRQSFGYLGVFALKFIPEGVKFGPFTELSTHECAWKIKTNKFVVRNDQLKCSHWMQYINFTRISSEQNLFVFQHENNLYYSSNRAIPEDEELLVYLGEEYRVALNEDVEIDFIPPTKKHEENVFACTFCCLGFNSDVYLAKHKGICSNGTNRKFSIESIVHCSFCKIYLDEREYFDYHKDYCREKNARQEVLPAADNRITKVKGRTFVSSKRNKQQCELYKCSRCEYKTTYRADFKNHTNKHYEIKKYRCGVCHKRFKQKGSLKRHVINIHNNLEKKESCRICDYKTNNKSHLKIHMNGKHSEQKSFKCSECDFKTCYKWSLKTHLNTKHYMEEVKRFKCPECGYRTKNKSYLSEHINAKHCEKKVKCPDCDYVTNYLSYLKTHIKRKHSEEKRFKCPKCDFKTNYKSYLKNHVIIKHSAEKLERFKCPECEFDTNYKSHLERHINVKHREGMVNPFKCPECEYKTIHKSNLKEHINAKHSEEKVERFKCSECKYKTNQKWSLKRHTNSKHAKDKVERFKCEQCDFKTNHKWDLKRHTNVKHIDEKLERFNCEECEFRTNYKWKLKKHVNLKHCEEKMESVRFPTETF